MALVQVLANQQRGPLPIKGTFQCLSSEAFDVFVTGVSWRRKGTQNVAAGVEIILTNHAGKQVGYTSGTITGDPPEIRRTIVSQWGQTSLNPGETYNFVIQPVFPECGSDNNDFYTATIIY